MTLKFSPRFLFRINLNLNIHFHFIFSSELVESDSDSGNERDKPLSSPSHKSDFREIIPEPSHVTSSAVQKHVTNNQKDPPEDGEEPLASKHLSSAKKNFLVKGKRLYKKGSHEEDNMVRIISSL